MSKFEMKWDGRIAKPDMKNARKRIMWAVKDGKVIPLEAYCIEGRLHYRENRSGSPRLHVLRSQRTFDAIYTERREAVEHVDPGKRTKVWMVDCGGEVSALFRSPSGQLYRESGMRLPNVKSVYASEREAYVEAMKHLRHEADREARELRAKRRKIAKLKVRVS